MALPKITTLHDLLPLLDGITTAQELGVGNVEYAPAKPSGLKFELAKAAREHLAFD